MILSEAILRRVAAQGRMGVHGLTAHCVEKSVGKQTSLGELVRNTAAADQSHKGQSHVVVDADNLFFSISQDIEKNLCKHPFVSLTGGVPALFRSHLSDFVKSLRAVGVEPIFVGDASPGTQLDEKGKLDTWCQRRCRTNAKRALVRNICEGTTPIGSLDWSGSWPCMFEEGFHTLSSLDCTIEVAVGDADSHIINKHVQVSSLGIISDDSDFATCVVAIWIPLSQLAWRQDDVPCTLITAENVTESLSLPADRILDISFLCGNDFSSSPLKEHGIFADVGIPVSMQSSLPHPSAVADWIKHKNLDVSGVWDVLQPFISRHPGLLQALDRSVQYFKGSAPAPQEFGDTSSDEVLVCFLMPQMQSAQFPRWSIAACAYGRFWAQDSSLYPLGPGFKPPYSVLRNSYARLLSFLGRRSIIERIVQGDSAMAMLSDMPLQPAPVLECGVADVRGCSAAPVPSRVLCVLWTLFGTTSLPTTQKLQSIADTQPDMLFISLLVQVLAASDLLSALELQCIVSTWFLLEQHSDAFSVAQGLSHGTVPISRPSSHCVHAISHICSTMEFLYSVLRLLSLGHLCTPPHAIFDGNIFSFLCQSLSLSIAGSQQIASHKEASLQIMRLVTHGRSPGVVSLWDDIVSPIARLQKFDEEWSIWAEVSFSASAKPALGPTKFKIALFCQCEARYDDDGKYYSATVVGVKGSQFLIKFVDYEDSYQVTSPENIRAPKGAVGVNVSHHQPLQTAAIEDPLAGLPIAGHVQQIIEAVAGSNVVVIEGETGCGKSSGIPIILYNNSKGPTKILITQPRRLACKTLSQRVASMLGTVVGGVVGYRVHGASCVSHLTAIEFVTTGWLLMRLAARPSLSEYSHVILDEVHERSEDSELLCTIVKKLSEKASSQSSKFPKLLVMSATLDSGLFSRYFSTLQSFPVPVLHVGAQRFPVEMIYIEDLLSLCKETRDPHLGTVESFHKECLPKKSKSASMKPDVRSGLYATVLVGIRALCRPGDSVLIFLPGSSEILEMIDWIERHSENALRSHHGDSNGQLRHFSLGRTHAVALHSMIPLEEQEESLQPPPADCIKIIVSTNLAESSVTIPHVKTVIDAGLQRSVSYDPHREVVSLKRQWCSQASARQRCGRVGRVCPGTVLRLYTREHHDRYMNAFEASGLLNAPLENIVLRLRLMLSSMGTVSEILSSSLEPPKPENISRAVQRLYELGALDGASENSNVTVLGQLAASLPSLSISSSRLILAGIICGCECEAALAAGAMSAQDPFSLPNRLFTKHHALFLQQSKESMEMRAEFDNRQYSDVIARVSLICNWFVTSKNFSNWCGDSKVSPSRVSQMLSSMEDAVISCSRALSKIIDLHKVDALHLSSKRFCDAACNLSALGDAMSSCRSLARKKASLKSPQGNFTSFFKAGPNSLRFAIAVSLSPNWIKGSFKSHLEELTSECPKGVDVSQCLSYNVSGRLADPEIFRASFGPFKESCRVYPAVKQSKKPVMIMEFRHRPMKATESSRVCSLSYIGPGCEVPAECDGLIGNPCSKWAGCQPVLVDIPIDAKCVISALSANPRVVGIPAELIKQAVGSPEWKPLNANEFGEVTEVVDIPRCVSKYKWNCMFAGGTGAMMPERSPLYRATDIRPNAPREIFAVIPSFINLESSHTAHVECPTIMPTQGRLAQLIVLLTARGSVQCSLDESNKHILDFEVSGDKVTLFPLTFGAADLAVVNCARAVFTSVFSGSVLALPTVHASLWRHLQSLFDRAAAAESSGSAHVGRAQTRQLLSTASKEGDLGFVDALQRVFEMFNVFPEWRLEYDAQMSRMRSSASNPALELPIPIIDVPLHRFSEPGLKQENPTLVFLDNRHIDTCRRFNVIFDEQRELAASMLKQQLPELPTKPGQKKAMSFVASYAKPLPKPQPLVPHDSSFDVSKISGAVPQRPAASGGAIFPKPRNIVLGHADKRFVLEDVESLPKQLKETPSFRAVCSRVKGLVIECYKELGGTRAVLLRSGQPEMEVNAKDANEAAKKIIAHLHESIRP